MPKIELSIETNLGPTVNTFKEANNLISQTDDAVQAVGKTGQNSFKVVTSEVNKLNTEVKKGTKELSNLDNSTKSVGKSVNRLRELKQEIKALTSEAIILKQQGDILGSEEAIKKAGQLKDEIKDIQDAIGAVSGNTKENFAKALGSATQIGVQGFEAMTAASSLFGEENKEVEKQLLKLQAIASLSRIASEFGDIGDKIQQVKIGLAPLGAGLKTIYTAGNEGLKNLAKNGIGSFSGLLTSAKGFFSNFGAGLKGLVQSGVQGIKALGAAASANPFGVILIAIVAVIAVMVALRDKVKPIAAIFKALGEFIDAIGDALQSLGEALNIVADAQERARDAIIKGNEEAVKAIERRYAREIKLASSAGKDTKAIEAEKLKEVYNTNQKTIEALLQKKNAVGELNKEELAQFRELNEKQLDIVTDVQALANEKRKEEADKENEKNKKILEDSKAAAEKLKQLRKELADFLLELQKRANAAEIELLTGADKINAQRKAAQDEIDLLKETLVKKKIAAKQGNSITQFEAEEFRKLELLADHQQADAIIKLEVEKSNKLAEEKRKQIDNEIKFLDTKNKLAIAQIQGTQNTTNLPEVEFEKAKQKAILFEQRYGAEAILDAKIEAIKNQKDVSKEQIQLETDLIIQETQNQVNAIDKQIAELNNSPKFSLAKLFGLSEEDFGKITQSFQQLQGIISDAFNEFINQQQQQLDKEQEANDKKVESDLAATQKRIDLSNSLIDQRQKELDDLQNNLKAQEGLKAEGLANDVDKINAAIEATRNQIEQENILKAQAIAEEQRINQEKLIEEARIAAERQKLAKQQAIADSIKQGSDILSAGATLLKVGAFAGPVGIAASIVTIAGMVAAFIKLKGTLQAAGFKDGVIDLQGPGTDRSDSIPANLSRGESVMTAQETRDNKNLFKGIRFKNNELIHKGILELIEGKGIGLEKDLPSSLAQKKDNIKASSLRTENLNKGVEERIESLYSEIKNLNKKLDNKITVLSNGTIIEKKGLITRTTKGKNG